MVAAFAQENGLANIVGTKTAGRLLSGSTFKAGFGYLLGLPVAAYLRWEEKLIEGKGVSPGRRVSTTLRQVLAKFSEFFMCWGFPQKNFAPGSPRSDDFQLGRPTVSPLLSFFKRISHLQS